MTRIARFVKMLLCQPLLGVLFIYRYGISPLFPGQCRFHPTCSHYAHQALRQHGPVYGSYLTLRRLSRCRPWGGSGYDPVADKHHNRESHEFTTK